MNNVWRLFRFDLGRLKANVMSIIITLGLVLVPSLFAWYNIIACWNVFDNTGNLTVAVANTDEGYQSDLIPLRINIGDQVVSALTRSIGTSPTRRTPSTARSRGATTPPW